MARRPDGGLVIVEGRSGSGKSRAAAEAVRRVTADRQLLIPARPDELAALSRAPGGLHGAVVWLDNLECFGGPGGLDLPMLERLCPQGRHDVVIVATLRSEERQLLERRPGIASGTTASTADALRVATVVRLGLEFSAAERERAAGMRADPRIADWLDSTPETPTVPGGRPSSRPWNGRPSRSAARARACCPSPRTVTGHSTTSLIISSATAARRSFPRGY